MNKYRALVYGSPVPQDWFDAIQEFLGSQATPNFLLVLSGTASVQLVAGTDNDQVGLGINGKFRIITATASAAHPGGAAGIYDVWAVASANNFVPGGGSGEVDNTDYTFGLRIVAGGSAAPTGTHNANAIAHTRKIATLQWSGTVITAINQIVASAASTAAGITTGRAMMVS